MGKGDFQNALVRHIQGSRLRWPEWAILVQKVFLPPHMVPKKHLCSTPEGKPGYYWPKPGFIIGMKLNAYQHSARGNIVKAYIHFLPLLTCFLISRVELLQKNGVPRT